MLKALFVLNFAGAEVAELTTRDIYIAPGKEK
jgi:hypothetical protein